MIESCSWRGMSPALWGIETPAHTAYSCRLNKKHSKTHTHTHIHAQTKPHAPAHTHTHTHTQYVCYIIVVLLIFISRVWVYVSARAMRRFAERHCVLEQCLKGSLPADTPGAVAGR